MKSFTFLSLIFIFVSLKTQSQNIAGMQPQISTDGKGIVRIVYGRNDSIFCETSTDGGDHFTNTEIVGKVHKMHLGMARGPQLATSNKVIMVTAIDQIGNIHYFILRDKKKWQEEGVVNTIKGSAPEGLMHIAADKNDNFYAVWLDTRIGKMNNICFATYKQNEKRWSTNKIIYRSPDKHVCECCRPSIAVNGKHVAVMFRNWVNGSRDLYFMVSKNNASDFSKPVMLGNDTWKLNGCPMDGGSLAFNTNSIVTVWRRHSNLYYYIPGSKEVDLGTGRNCTITSQKNMLLASYTQDGKVKIKDLKLKTETLLGNGDYLKVNIVGDKIICVWEDDKKIKIKSFKSLGSFSE